MLFLQHKLAALSAVLALSVSCAHHPAAFQVLPGAPSYLLRSPDKQETLFPNVLRDFNGFEPGKSWVDLRPLMELRIENAYYQPGASRRGLDGYLGTEVARYAVTPEGLRLLSTQPMAGRPEADKPVQQLISSSVAHSRFYRLYFEIVFNKSTNARGSVLLAADSTAQLEQLSAALTNPDAVCGGASPHCTSFPEACSVSLEMKLTVNGKDDIREWGSLLTNVVGTQPRRLQLRRFYAGRLTSVNVNLTDQAALRLPLLPGDHIVWD